MTATRLRISCARPAANSPTTAEADALYRRIKDKAPAALAARFRAERYPAGPKDAAPYFTGY